MTSRPPNILLLLPDQHRPDWMSFDRSLPLRTPHLEALAARGMRFTHAFTPSPMCAPARACLATGRDYARCGVRHNGDNTPRDVPTYYSHLREAGYEVAGVGKFDLHKPDRNWGLDGRNLMSEYGFTGGIDSEGKGDALTSYFENANAPKGPYMQFLRERGLIDAHLAMYAPHINQPGWLNFPAVTTLPDDAYCDNWVAQNAVDCLRRFPEGKPWHLVVNFVGPHGPFDVTAAMWERWKNTALPAPVDNRDPDQRIVLERRQNYAAMIENIDTRVGELIQLVKERGEIGNTLMVYSSDHGEMLGDHGRWGKGLHYTPSTGIPLIVAGPGVRSGVTSQALVSLHDLAATFVDFANAVSLSEADALSLRPVLAGEKDTHRRHICSALGDWTMIFDGHHKGVFFEDRCPELFDLKHDPLETRNLSALPEMQDTVKALRQKITRLRVPGPWSCS